MDRSPLRRCASCGAFLLEGSVKCGLCASTLLAPLDQGAPVARASQPPKSSSGRRNAIITLTVGTAVLVEGVIFAFLPISPGLTVLGFFMMMFGTIVVLLPLGVLSGVPYRGLLLNRADRELQRRERRKYAD